MLDYGHPLFQMDGSGGVDFLLRKMGTHATALSAHFLPPAPHFASHPLTETPNFVTYFFIL
jgi:hypothetical protein